MQEGLSARQTKILKDLIDEYIETALPVGSVSLENKYGLGFSPATIRNEMVVLTKLGFLRQPHTSAGRIPTPKAMKFYINQLMEEKRMSVAEEVKAKENIWDSRDDFDELMTSATKSLSQRTDVWSYGHSNLFSCPEFFDYQVCKTLFSILEEEEPLQNLFFSDSLDRSPIEILFGEEIGWDFFEPVGIVAARFQIGEKQGAIGVVGPYRLNYASVIPTVRYFGNLIQQLGS